MISPEEGILDLNMRTLRGASVASFDDLFL